MVWGLLNVTGRVNYYVPGLRIELKMGDRIDTIDTLGLYWNWTVNTYQYDDGVTELSARTRRGETVGPRSSVEVIVANEENAPIIVIHNPSEGATITSDQVLVSGYVLSDLPVQYVRVRISGLDWNDTWYDANGTSIWSFNLSMDDLDNGRYLIQVLCSNGYISSDIYSVPVWIEREDSNGDDAPYFNQDFKIIIIFIIFFVMFCVVIYNQIRIQKRRLDP